MKRSEFLKILGIGVAAAVVAPVIITELVKEDNPLGLTDGIFGHMERNKNLVYLKARRKGYSYSHLLVNDKFIIGKPYEFWVEPKGSYLKDHFRIQFRTEFKGQIFKDAYTIPESLGELTNEKFNHFAEKFYKYVSGIEHLWYTKNEADLRKRFENYQEQQTLKHIFGQI